MVKVYAVRIGNKYGPEYEDYLKEKIAGITFINKSTNPFILQWNKLRFMDLDIDEPICVIDVDIGLFNNYNELFNYPIKKGEFISIPSWWKDTHKEEYKINGGFYKYYPKECKYIVDRFREKPEYYTTKYIKNQTTVGPVNGEQYFVEDTARENLEVRTVPEWWVQRAFKGKFFQDGEVKLVHYSFD
jgi:hypothetical protein